MIEQKDKKTSKRKVYFMLFTLAVSAVAVAFYRFSLYVDFLFPIVMWAYLVGLAVLAIVYIFYNRGFLRKGITEDMLPQDWDDERKKAFVEDSARRIKKSAWMPAFAIAFFVTFFVEALDLFVIPIVNGWFR